MTGLAEMEMRATGKPDSNGNRNQDWRATTVRRAPPSKGLLADSHRALRTITERASCVVRRDGADARANGLEWLRTCRRLQWLEPMKTHAVIDWAATIHGDHANMVVVANLDDLEPANPSAFWNAHAGNGLVFVTDEGVPETTRDILSRRNHGPWM